jgi:hypothetical protein
VAFGLFVVVLGLTVFKAAEQKASASQASLAPSGLYAAGL